MTQTTIRRRVLRRFYEPLLLLNALGQIRGERIKSEVNTDTLSPNIQKLRRSFVDGIAYICAHEKDSSRVTAVALEKTPQGITVWLAANEKVGEKVIQFLENILSDIQRISELNDSESRRREGERTKEDLTSRVIAFNAPRIRTYYDQVARKRAPACLEIIDEGHENSGDRTARMGQSHLAEWLRENFVNGTSSTPNNTELQALVRKCYENRRSPAFDTLKRLAGQGETRRLEFEQLYNLLYKLGKHIHIAKKLIEAAISLSQDFMEGFRIEALPSSKEQKLPLTSKEATIESTIRRMFSNSEDRRKFMARLQFIWDPSELSELLKRQHKIKTRVHAELLLIDHFDKQECSFLDGNDKYIGCSKPACYLCHAYITSHPGRYTVPPSHQKLYVGWRPPDIDPKDTACAARYKSQEQVMMKLIEWVRGDIKTDIESRFPRLPYHADSTVGMTSTSKTLASNALSLYDLDIGAIDINHSKIADLGEYQAQSGTSDISDDDGGVRLD